MTSISSSPIQLAAPGAGLPWPELWIGRMLFAFSRWGHSRHAATAQFLREQLLIAGLIERCDAALASQRVLIPRLRGLEDSSRYWSVAMTLEHLRITNTAFSEIIRSLGRNIVPPGVVSTAAVKPSPEATLEVAGAYTESCSQVLAAVAENPNLRTPFKYAHPWFGHMNGEGWHLLAGMHMRIHRKQMESILSRLA